MAMTADVARLLAHPRRRDIASVTLDAPLTVGEIADRLHTKDGAIRTTVETLVRDGLLAKSERPGLGARRGAAEYRVTPEHVVAVREHCRAVEEPTLEDGAEVLLIPLAGLAAAARVLARERPSVVAWAVRTRDPQLSMMLGLHRDAPPDTRDALLLALRDDGVDCARLHVGETFTPSVLFEYAGKLATERRRVLPSGT
jgi:DNA-binding transcriptional ArsR family regulator